MSEQKIDSESDISSLQIGEHLKVQHEESSKKTFFSFHKRQNEKLLAARTPEKSSKSSFTQRVFFHRRERFQNKNLIIIYFDGVLGDLQSKKNSYGNFRVRTGAWNGLRSLHEKHQIVLLIPYNTKRQRLLSTYIHRY